MQEIDTSKLEAFFPLIDDRSEELIYQQASDRVSAESNGLINDFSDNGAAGVLLRAQSFTHAELLYRINKLPLLILLAFLAKAGITRSVGSKAIAGLTVTLTAVRPVAFTLPLGFVVTDSSGSLAFETTEQLIIPAGQLVGTVGAIAQEVGEVYNLPPFRINSFTRPLTFLSSVSNIASAQGGVESEPIEDAINRGISVIRTRNLVSAIDFSEAAQDILGAGSKATAIGLLGANRITFKLGAVHLFCASAQDEPSNFGALQAVRGAIAPRLMLGTQLYVSAMEFTLISLRIFMKSNQAGGADELATNLWNAYRDYLSLKRFEPGQTVFIEEVRYILRQVSGVALIDYILLNNEGSNIPMPNSYTLPTADFLVTRISDVNGQTYEIARGSLDDENVPD
jgi:hypothetical protein